MRLLLLPSVSSEVIEEVAEDRRSRVFIATHDVTCLSFYSSLSNLYGYSSMAV